MNILLSNDDGIEAEGIRVLAERLKQDNHNILIVAPSRERSATSHAATIGKPLYLTEYKKIEGVQAYALSGKPADCVKFAAYHFEQAFPIDLVISGINRGQNLGTDIVYSGTVGAAQEGALLGLNSVAVSCEYHKDKSGKYNYFSTQIDYVYAADFIAQNLDLFARHKTPDTFFNVNVPDTKPIKGMKIVKHGRSRYIGHYESRTDEKGKEFFRLIGELLSDTDDSDTDLKYFHDGYITITPIFYSRTNNKKLDEMREENK